ncbi:MAG: hypothetical protein ACKOC0_09165, partial [Cytophagales bacterium]
NIRHLVTILSYCKIWVKPYLAIKDEDGLQVPWMIRNTIIRLIFSNLIGFKESLVCKYANFFGITKKISSK